MSNNETTEKLTTFAIILPVKNEEKNIRNCFDSILNQTFTDWICCVCNDGSTDRTKDICIEYAKKDNRFIVIDSPYKKYMSDGKTLNNIDKDMAGISNMLNLGISVTKSKYIVRMDGDDEMLPNRLQITYDWMESHPDNDIVGFPIIFNNDKKIYNLSSMTDEDDGTCTWTNLMANVKPYHPTVCMRRDSVISKTKFLYQQPYDGNEDAFLWMHAKMWGCKIVLANAEPVLLYKGGRSTKQMLDVFDRLNKAYKQTINKDKNTLLHYNYNKNNKLTVVIGFKNENIEVEKTVLSLLLSDTNIDIVLIDDASDDGYDYKRVADTFGCFYYKNETSKGVAGAREVGVTFVKTPYFMLMDAHMRININNKNFSERFVKALDEDDNRIVQCNTVVMKSNANEDSHFRHYTNEDCFAQPTGAACIGAKYNQQHAGRDWAGDWCYEFMDNKENRYDLKRNDENLFVECMCLMGADYAMSVRWWNKIGGLKGLDKWGHDEPLLSIKTHLMGGKIMTYPNYGIGHLYRTTPVYGILSTAYTNVNLLFIQFLMSHSESPNETDDQIFERYKNKMHAAVGEDMFFKIMNIFNGNRIMYNNIKDWLWKNAVKKVSDLRDFYKRFN